MVVSHSRFFSHYSYTDCDFCIDSSFCFNLCRLYDEKRYCLDVVGLRAFP